MCTMLLLAPNQPLQVVNDVLLQPQLHPQRLDFVFLLLRCEGGGGNLRGLRSALAPRRRGACACLLQEAVGRSALLLAQTLQLALDSQVFGSLLLLLLIFQMLLLLMGSLDIIVIIGVILGILGRLC